MPHRRYSFSGLPREEQKRIRKKQKNCDHFWYEYKTKPGNAYRYRVCGDCGKKERY